MSGGIDVQIPDRLYFRIGEVAELAGVKPYVLRYWESEFPVLSPEKSSTGQRVYRRTDVETLLLIKHLLYGEKYSIEGARKRIRELKREGELTRYKRENVLGGEEAVSRKELLKAIRDEAVAIAEAARRPLRDTFKF